MVVAKIKKYNPKENNECYVLVRYLRKLRQMGIKLRFSHIKNEGKKTFQQMGVDKAMGVCAGVPDYILIMKGRLFFIEMKRIKGSKTSEEQEERAKYIESTGNSMHFCKGFIEAKKVIDAILFDQDKNV